MDRSSVENGILQQACIRCQCKTANHSSLLHISKYFPYLKSSSNKKEFDTRFWVSLLTISRIAATTYQILIFSEMHESQKSVKLEPKGHTSFDMPWVLYLSSQYIEHILQIWRTLKDYMKHQSNYQLTQSLRNYQSAIDELPQIYISYRAKILSDLLKCLFSFLVYNLRHVISENSQ